jgi:hypothetical protein
MKVSTENDNNFGYEKKTDCGRQYPFKLRRFNSVYSSGVLSLMKNNKMSKRKKAITDYFMHCLIHVLFPDICCDLCERAQEIFSVKLSSEMQLTVGPVGPRGKNFRGSGK